MLLPRAEQLGEEGAGNLGTVEKMQQQDKVEGVIISL